MLKIIGILVVLVTVICGYLFAGGSLRMLWQPSEYVIILGAAAGSILLANDKEVLRDIGSQCRRAFVKHDDRDLYQQFILLTMEVLENTKRQGLKYLDEHIENPQESTLFAKYPLILNELQLVTFLTDNLRLLSMGKIEGYELEAILDKEIAAMVETRLAASVAVGGVAEAMPGFGIMAAVLAIVITMGKIDAGIVVVGLNVAGALIGTFFGIFMCYGLLSPLSEAMKATVERDMTLLYACREVLINFAAGKSPLMSVDAGRRMIPEKYKPTFSVMETWIEEGKAQ
ncbi:MotA family flagellar motor rotation protein [Buttiauxella ferragutiae ATCC 51602]|jgi:chemotaxis protein MotA|uniref:MotA family flagellar motor rotation protein n=1 Tax=Buttiauxella ferragutiae ATCC 51602 TaxID=1354252 RepID=A0ABX2W8Z2_9ENTR|nr:MULTISPECIES: flagellar motor stator protein MotA [Buttiauxella]OAT28113.1 MotA family flagellar motor rotation protein [Buttiauxella ferragutiae ATCC 51602]TDN49817.1 chemotaxis protein MotA [Buttiauxella sp. JUb87]